MVPVQYIQEPPVLLAPPVSHIVQQPVASIPFAPVVNTRPPHVKTSPIIVPPPPPIRAPVVQNRAVTPPPFGVNRPLARSMHLGSQITTGIARSPSPPKSNRLSNVVSRLTSPPIQPITQIKRPVLDASNLIVNNKPPHIIPREDSPPGIVKGLNPPRVIREATPPIVRQITPPKQNIQREVTPPKPATTNIIRSESPKKVVPVLPSVRPPPLVV